MSLHIGILMLVGIRLNQEQIHGRKGKYVASD